MNLLPKYPEPGTWLSETQSTSDQGYDAANFSLQGSCNLKQK